MGLENVVNKLHSAYKGTENLVKYEAALIAAKPAYKKIEKFVKYEAALIAAEPAGLIGRLVTGKVAEYFTSSTSVISAATLAGDYICYNGMFSLVYYLSCKKRYKGNLKGFAQNIFRCFIIPDTPFTFVDYGPSWIITKTMLDHGVSTELSTFVAYVAATATYHTSMQLYRHFIVEKDIDKKLAKKCLDKARCAAGIFRKKKPESFNNSETFKNNCDYSEHSGNDSPVV